MRNYSCALMHELPRGNCLHCYAGWQYNLMQEWLHWLHCWLTVVNLSLVTEIHWLQLQRLHQLHCRLIVVNLSYITEIHQSHQLQRDILVAFPVNYGELRLPGVMRQCSFFACASGS